MHILFVNAALGGDYSTEDIAVTALATYLNERTDHTAAICDLTFHRRHWRKHLQNAVQTRRPDLIGISANTLYMQHVERICSAVKEDFGIPVILGGYHASIKPDACFDVPGVEHVCIGDGELTLTQLLDRLSGGPVFEPVNGIWSRIDNTIVQTERGEFIEDIDSLPIPNWDLWEDLDKYFYFLGMLYTVGSRGCPYRCSYCDAVGIANAVKGSYYRIRDPRSYAQEIGHQVDKYKDRDLRLIQCFDPVFTHKLEWVEAFADEYIKLGLNRRIKYSAFSRIDHITEDKVAALAESGCALLRVGVEAGDPHIRNDIYKKHLSNDQIRDMFQLCKSHGIGFTSYYMLGGPDEDRQTMQKTLDLADELDAERSAFFVFKPFTEEGCALVKKHGGLVADDWWHDVDNITFGVAVESDKLKARTIKWFQAKGYFRTFGRRLLRMIRRLKLTYFTRLITYMARGIACGLSASYLIIYYHIYSYDNTDK